MARCQGTSGKKLCSLFWLPILPVTIFGPTATTKTQIALQLYASAPLLTKKFSICTGPEAKNGGD